MSFRDWIYSVYPADSAINGRWGLLHIGTILLCFTIIAAITYFVNKAAEKTKQNIIKVLAVAVLLFEIARRIINLSKGCTEFTDYMRVLLPRPWCAISCWLLIVSAFVKRKFLYNFTAMNALLCAIIFFAHPVVGFNDKYILFENLYSISTHSLLLISSISMMTLGLTDFSMKREEFIKEAMLLVGVYIYGFIEVFVLKIEADPLFFMPDGEVQEVLGIGYGLYLVIYLVFLAVYFSIFYAVQKLLDTHRKKVLASVH